MSCKHIEYCDVQDECPGGRCRLRKLLDGAAAWGREHGVTKGRGSKADRARIAVGLTELYCELLGFDHRLPNLETALVHTATGLTCEPLDIEANAKANLRTGTPPPDVLKTYPYGPNKPTRLSTMLTECLRRCHDGHHNERRPLGSKTGGALRGKTLDAGQLAKKLRSTIR